MTTPAIPKGFHTLTPYLAVKGVDKLIDFLERGLGARIDECHRRPDGAVMNAEATVGDSKLMMGEIPDERDAHPCMLYMYVEDADRVYAQAIQAGGKPVQPMTDQFYGDRSGAIEDPAGNQWWIATRKENFTPDELARRSATARG